MTKDDLADVLERLVAQREASKLAPKVGGCVGVFVCVLLVGKAPKVEV